MTRQRVILRLDAEAASDEGRLLTYLKTDSAVPYRMAVFRALRVFYLPWALEPEQSSDELQRLARTVLEEMQLRSLQLQSRFLAIADAPTWITLTPNREMSASPGTTAPAEPQSGKADHVQPFINPDIDLAVAGLDDF